MTFAIATAWLLTTRSLVHGTEASFEKPAGFGFPFALFVRMTR